MTGLIENFQEFRKILCVCPCCGMLVRVSDLKLKTKGAGVTWLDKYEKEIQKIGDKEEEFGEKEEGLREIAVARGRKEAEKVFNGAVSPEFKKLKLDPLDVKPLFNPVDFIVFNGMNKKEKINDIIFLSKKSKYSALNETRRNIAQLISKEKYGWQVARIEDSGRISFE